MTEDEKIQVDLYKFLLEENCDDYEHKLAHLLAENVLFLNIS